MATFRIHEDESTMAGAKRKFEEETDANENVTKKGDVHQRVALQFLNNHPQVDSKRIKTVPAENVRTILVEGDQREGGASEDAKVEEEEQLNMDNLQLNEAKPERISRFPKELKNDDEYRGDIFQYITQLELRYEWPTRNCIEKQSHVTADMRTVLVDWLVTVAGEYQLSSKTVHLAVNYIDRFISKMLVATEKFQLLGAAAMVVAGKMEEIYPPELKEFVYLCGDAYTLPQIKKMEQMVLNVLKFDLQPPTVLSFINHICTEHQLDKKTLYLAMYLSELVLLDGVNFFEYLPSKLAAACVALSRLTLSKRKPWPKQMVSFSGYTLNQLSPVVKKQHKAFEDSPRKPQKAVYNKYLTDKYQNVAALKPKNLTLDFQHEE